MIPFKVRVVFVSGLLACAPVFGAGEVEELEDAPRLSTGEGVQKGKVNERLRDDAAEAQILAFGLRADAAFSAGRPTSQGFSLPGLRVNFFGEIHRRVEYRVSLAPTREFGSAQLPQVLPNEAWIQWRGGATEGWGSEGVLQWKLGMFAPEFLPTWSPDLAELPLPNYSRVHERVLLFRELGSQLSVQPWPGRLKLSAGLYNGNGVSSLNTNNAKAFVGSGSFSVPMGLGWLRFGLSGFGLRQADGGSVNYVSNTVGAAYVWYEPEGRTRIGVDLLTGRLEDASRTVSLFGATFVAHVGVTDWVGLYFRGEALRYSPALEAKLNRVQLGPVVEIVRGVRAFLTFEHQDNGTAASENSGELLVRVSL